MFRKGDLVFSEHYQLKCYVLEAYKYISIIESFDGKKHIVSNDDITLADFVTEDEQMSCFSGERK